MVSGKAVNNVQVLPQCFLVFLRAEDWSHLSPPLTNGGDVILREKEVVRTNLTRHWKTLLLRKTNYEDLKTQKQIKLITLYKDMLRARML